MCIAVGDIQLAPFFADAARLVETFQQCPHRVLIGEIGFDLVVKGVCDKETASAAAFTDDTGADPLRVLQQDLTAVAIQ